MAKQDSSQRQEVEQDFKEIDSQPLTLEPISPSRIEPTPRAAAPVLASNAPRAPQDAMPAVGLQGPQDPRQVAEYLKQQDQAWTKDLVSQHIKPKTYQDLYADKDTLGKITTLFGLLVGGIGSGLTGRENAITAMMDKEIENDLAAQKTSKENAYNFLRLNQQHQKEGTEIRKTNAETDILTDSRTQMLMNRTGLHALAAQVDKLAQAAAADPRNQQKAMQLQRYQQALGIIGAGVDEKNGNIADRAAATSALMGGLSSGADKDHNQLQQGLIASGDPKLQALAKDRAEKYIPGHGMASVAPTAADREQITTGETFQEQLQEFTDWAKAHGNNTNPKEHVRGQALAAGLQNAYRAAINGGVYKEGEQGFISKIIDSTPTKFFNSIRVIPKLEAVQQDSQRQLNDLLKSKGLKPYKDTVKSKEKEPKGPKEGAMSKSKSGKPIIFTNGAWKYI